MSAIWVSCLLLRRQFRRFLEDLRRPGVAKKLDWLDKKTDTKGVAVFYVDVLQSLVVAGSASARGDGRSCSAAG